MGRGSRLALSAAIAVVIFASLASSGRYTAPVYGKVVTLLVSQLGPGEVDIHSDDRDVVIRYQGDIRDVAAGWRMLGLRLYSLISGPFLLTALILATPGCGWRSKAYGLLGNWFGFFMIHAILAGTLSWILVSPAEGGPITQGALAEFLGPVMLTTYVLIPAFVGGAWCTMRWLPGVGVRLSLRF